MTELFTDEDLKGSTILVVDDNEENLFLLRLMVEEAGYRVMEAKGGLAGLDLAFGKRRTIDMILLDIMMPDIDGFEVTRRLKSDPKTRHIPIILLTAKKVDHSDIAEGLNLGAEDFLTKPVDALELMARTKSLLRAKKMSDRLKVMNDDLEQLVEERTFETLSARDATMFGFAKLAEYRDPETGGHLERIRNYSRALAIQLKGQNRFGGIDDDFINQIYFSSPLHDIGKVGIPDAILLKPGKLTTNEFEIMKTHSEIGRDTLLAAEARSVASDNYLCMGARIAGGHHEKWDGSGYPDGLKGENIPLAARIMAVADVYDALVSKRVYKEGFSHEKARSIIQKGSGSHFDPAMVDAFIAIEEQFIAIRKKHEDDNQV